MHRVGGLRSLPTVRSIEVVHGLVQHDVLLLSEGVVDELRVVIVVLARMQVWVLD